MHLGELLPHMGEHTLKGNADADIVGITYDSRKVEPRWAFFCIRGFRHDGHEFVKEALAKGASVIVAEREVETHGRPLVLVEDPRRAMAAMASHFYGHPSKALRIIGVTGTNGKTTTTHMIRHILMEMGYNTDLVGTVTNIVGGYEVPVRHTTPESVDLMRLFSEMLGGGSTHAVMEVSSHALELARVAGCEFDVGVFTNLTQDHLDFHGNLEAYGESKAILFRSLGLAYHGVPKTGPKHAIINRDDPAFEYFAAQSRVPVVTYGIREEADIRARDIEVKAQGTRLRLMFPEAEMGVNLRVTGRFNVYNVLAAVAVARAEGAPLEVIKRALEDFPGVRGRFEVVSHPNEPTLIVDYAHTPDGLKNVLETAREITRNYLYVVFGCGGDRDKTKRPIMGRIAAELADGVLVTSDNPRSEDPREVAEDVEAGVREVRTQGYEVILDRRSAITRAVSLAKEGDVVVIAGKGHETYQIFRDGTVAFDDAEVAREALRRGGQG